MSRRFILALLCLAGLAGQLQAQDQLRRLLPTDDSLSRVGLSRKWFAFAPIDGSRETIQEVKLMWDQIHLQTNASRIHAIDAESGKVLWSTQLGNPIPGQFGSAINSNSVFVINGSRLYRLSRGDGSQLWSIHLPQSPNAPPAADENNVIVGTLNGRVYVFNVNTKEVRWFYQTNGPISVPALAIDDRFACASEDGKMYVFSPANRNPTLRYQTDAAVSAPLAAWGRAAILPSEDFNLYSVDVRTGETNWRYAAGSEIRQPVTVIGSEIFVFPDDGGMHVLNAESGSRVWRHPRGRDFIAASRDRVYATDSFGQLLVLDRATGRQIGSWNARDFQFHVRNDSNDRVYLVSKSGMLVCLCEPKNEAPSVHQKVLPPQTTDEPGRGQSGTGKK